MTTDGRATVIRTKTGMKNRRRKNRKNIVRFPGGIHLNIGVVTFLFIAVYIVINVFHYFTVVQIRNYEVVQGTIEVNTSYTGLILRSETVVTAAHSGKLDYFLKDQTKAANGTLICSIDENGSVSDKLNAAVDSGTVLKGDSLEEIQADIRDYSKSYQDSNYYTTYNFKSDLGGKLMEALNLGALNAISDYTDYARENQYFHLYHASQPGIVAYYTDGLETVTPQAITADLFDPAAHQKNSLLSLKNAEVGQPLYKLITDEKWQIIVPVEPEMKARLADGETVQIRFKEDQATTWVNYTIEQLGGQDYLILYLNHSMIRYAHERYIDIHILLDQQSGLKIPNSSITTKTFDLVPSEYFTQGNGNSNQSGLIVEHKLEDGTYSPAEFVAATVYYEDEEAGLSYISEETIQTGDVIVMNNSTQRYEVAKTADLKGVYNVNKGYAVFRQIEEIYHNDDYTIVKSGTSYGITLYDYIALESSAIKEDEMINQ